MFIPEARVLKLDKNELRLWFHYYILIPRKYSRKTPFRDTVPPNPPFRLFDLPTALLCIPKCARVLSDNSTLFLIRHLRHERSEGLLDRYFFAIAYLAPVFYTVGLYATFKNTNFSFWVVWAARSVIENFFNFVSYLWGGEISLKCL